MEETMERTGSNAGSRWSTYGIGGLASLCCVFLASAMAAAAGGTISGGVTATLGGTIVRIVVTVLAVGTVAAGISAGRRVRPGESRPNDGCGCDR